MRTDHRAHRLFVEASLHAGADVVLSPEQSHYLDRVMRAKTGDVVIAFNNRDGEWRGHIAETGRKAVNVNRLMTDHVEGMPREDSDRLLGAVFDHAENREWIYEHVWRRHDLVLWDNRCSMHARTDFPENERRLMLRTTLEGGLRPE